MEGTVFKLFQKLEVAVDPSDLEDWHGLRSKDNKKATIKLSKRKDSNKIRQVKKKN